MSLDSSLAQLTSIFVLSNLHSSADVVTKASAKKVSDIIPVVDDAGAVLMYAINYHEGGYDGYYVDPNITTSDGITYHFTGDRKDLLITP